jgi:hypothetical protein
MKIGNTKSIKPRMFKFEKGQNWDGDEEIFHYIEELLGVDEWEGNIPKVKQKTYITIMGAVINQKSSASDKEKKS